MNRDLILRDITPAKARVIVSAMHGMNAYVDPYILDLAKHDTINSLDHPTLDPRQIDLMQFIMDRDHRCAIPYDDSAPQIRAAIAATIPEDAPVLILDDPSLWWAKLLGVRITPFSEKNNDRCQWVSLRSIHSRDIIRLRHSYTIVKLSQEHVAYEWLGKLFPKLIIYTEMTDQYTFKLGGFSNHINAALHASAILFPHLVEVYGRDKNIRREDNATLPMIGAFSKYMKTRATNNKFRRNNT